MATLGNLMLWLKADDKDAQKGLARFQKSAAKTMNTVGRGMQSVGRGMRNVGFAMTAAFSGVMIAAVSFDKKMREVNTMMGLSAQEFEAFKDEILELSKRMGVDAVDAANALYQAISAGVPKNNVVAFLETATKASIAGVTDLETAVDGITSVLNAFHMKFEEAEKVADIMFTTVKNGKTTFDQLSRALFNVAPTAAAVGVSFEEVAAATATLTKQGVPTRVATTQIRAAIVSLLKPTEDMAKKLEAMGFASGEAMLKQLGLVDSFAALRKDIPTQELATLLGSVESLQGVLGVTGENSVTFAADLEAMGSAAGATAEAFAVMEESTARKWERLTSRLKITAIVVGNELIPVFEKLIEELLPIVKALGEWAAAHPKLLSSLAALGLILAVGGPIISGLGAFVSAIGAVIGIAGIGGFLAGLGAVVAAGGVGYALGTLLRKMSDKWFPWFNKAVDSATATVYGWGVSLLKVLGLLKEIEGAKYDKNYEVKSGAEFKKIMDEKMRAASSGGGTTNSFQFNVQGMTVSSPDDAKHVAKELYRQMETRLLARGLRAY